jgi:multidrug transporter EmrE-like cation transporter
MSKNIQMSKWLAIAAICSAMTVIILKQYEKYPTNWLLLAVAISEFMLIYSYIQLLKNDNIISLFGLIKIIAILLVAVSGFLFFENKLTIKQGFGVFFSLIAIYLLN